MISLFAKPHEHDIMKGRERDDSVQVKTRSNASVSKMKKAKGKFTQNFQLLGITIC